MYRKTFHFKLEKINKKTSEMFSNYIV